MNGDFRGVRMITTKRERELMIEALRGYADLIEGSALSGCENECRQLANEIATVSDDINEGNHE